MRSFAEEWHAKTQIALRILNLVPPTRHDGLTESEAMLKLLECTLDELNRLEDSAREENLRRARSKRLRRFAGELQSGTVLSGMMVAC